MALTRCKVHLRALEKLKLRLLVADFFLFRKVKERKILKNDLKSLARLCCENRPDRYQSLLGLKWDCFCYFCWHLTSNRLALYSGSWGWILYLGHRNFTDQWFFHTADIEIKGIIVACRWSQKNSAFIGFFLRLQSGFVSRMAFSIKNVFLSFLQCFSIFFCPPPHPKTPRGFAPGADFAESLKQVAPLVFQTSRHPWAR